MSIDVSRVALGLEIMVQLAVALPNISWNDASLEVPRMNNKVRSASSTLMRRRRHDGKGARGTPGDRGTSEERDSPLNAEGLRRLNF